MSSALMPAKKLYAWLYSRTCSRQNRQYSRSRSRPLGARWVAGAWQFGHSHPGHCARRRRSLSGLTRMRSNRGESLFMTDQYARRAEPSSSLDTGVCAFSRPIDRPVRLPLCRAMAIRDIITEKLTKAFAPASLNVLDESYQHVGHAGYREGGETHFRVYIVAEAFRGKSRLERHRMVNETLVAELKGGVHALAIHAAAPGEAGA